MQLPMKNSLKRGVSLEVILEEDDNSVVTYEKETNETSENYKQNSTEGCYSKPKNIEKNFPENNKEKITNSNDNSQEVVKSRGRSDRRNRGWTKKRSHSCETLTILDVSDDPFSKEDWKEEAKLWNTIAVVNNRKNKYDMENLTNKFDKVKDIMNEEIPKRISRKKILEENYFDKETFIDDTDNNEIDESEEIKNIYEDQNKKELNDNNMKNITNENNKCENNKDTYNDRKDKVINEKIIKNYNENDKSKHNTADCNINVPFMNNKDENTNELTSSNTLLRTDSKDCLFEMNPDKDKVNVAEDLLDLEEGIYEEIDDTIWKENCKIQNKNSEKEISSRNSNFRKIKSEDEHSDLTNDFNNPNKISNVENDLGKNFDTHEELKYTRSLPNPIRKDKIEIDYYKTIEKEFEIKVKHKNKRNADSEDKLSQLRRKGIVTINENSWVSVGDLENLEHKNCNHINTEQRNVDSLNKDIDLNDDSLNKDIDLNDDSLGKDRGINSLNTDTEIVAEQNSKIHKEDTKTLPLQNFEDNKDNDFAGYKNYTRDELGNGVDPKELRNGVDPKELPEKHRVKTMKTKFEKSKSTSLQDAIIFSYMFDHVRTNPSSKILRFDRNIDHFRSPSRSSNESSDTRSATSTIRVGYDTDCRYGNLYDCRFDFGLGQGQLYCYDADEETSTNEFYQSIGSYTERSNRSLTPEFSSYETNASSVVYLRKPKLAKRFNITKALNEIPSQFHITICEKERKRNSKNGYLKYDKNAKNGENGQEISHQFSKHYNYSYLNFQNSNKRARNTKWTRDTESLSSDSSEDSGVSKDINSNKKTENIAKMDRRCRDIMLKDSYGNQTFKWIDPRILAKIRSMGTTVLYFGPRSKDSKNSDVAKQDEYIPRNHTKTLRKLKEAKLATQSIQHLKQMGFDSIRRAA